MASSLEAAVSKYGADAKAKLSNPAAAGQPEDQLRSPFEQLLKDLAAVAGVSSSKVVVVGETAVGDLKTRPDFAVTFDNALVGFVELKAPGKGADPRKFKDAHDKAQWEKLRSLPNLLYSDGNEFSLWQNGELVDSVISFVGDVEKSGSKLTAPPKLPTLFGLFLFWEPIPPRNASQLARMSAQLCRLLRDEVTEQLAEKSEALTALATDWRRLLFPNATDERFADGYAQAVTFGLLMARAREIDLAQGLDGVAKALAKSNSLIGTALRLLTDSAENQKTLRTSLGTLTRVLDAVDWPTISKGKPEAWLYFYEDFLEVYDNDLRKLTGSYYTPPEVVNAMVRLVDEVLQSARFGQPAGLASNAVTLADPAVGTGTFVLGVLRTIAERVKADEGEGAIPGAVNDALKRLIAFEMQLGPFAVAQLRLLAEIVDLTGAAPVMAPRMFVTDTLGNPDDEEGWIPAFAQPIAKSRKEANKIKREEPITVVIGNPPYREKAKGRGGWIEQGSENTTEAPLRRWIPPREWGVGAHAKHLYNLYIYFWRWATWKVFDHHPDKNTGVVCFITVAGFLAGPGFQRMRDYLRRTCDDVWVIDCSPEGHQPGVNTRIFQGVQQPVCIVLASRSAKSDTGEAARVRFRALRAGTRIEKFEELAAVSPFDDGWIDCSEDWRSPFRPAATGPWASYPALEELFVYSGSGVQPKRTWVIAPDSDSLRRRWDALIHAPNERKEDLFHPTLRDGKPADRHIASVVNDGIPGFEPNPTPLRDEVQPCPDPVRYGFRSFDRQWIIPDARVITQPNAELWRALSPKQVFTTALSRTAPSAGPAITFGALVPDLDHYNGRGGRAFPLWIGPEGTQSNLRPGLTEVVAERLKRQVSPEDLLAYIAAVVAHPAYVARFKNDLATPGLRVPITADAELFGRAVEVGRRVLWLQTFGERMSDASEGRPPGPPRLPLAQRPTIPAEGEIPPASAAMPDSINYDAKRRRLRIGSGFVENVPPQVWHFEVSGKQVLLQWFSYRRKTRDRPLIGKRRPPSALGKIQADHWLPEYTTELINLLNVLGGLIELEPVQAKLLEEVCGGATIAEAEFREAGVFDAPRRTTKAKAKSAVTPSLFGDDDPE